MIYFNSNCFTIAFATRPIAKGSILAPAPVVQIVDRKALEIEKIREDGVKEVTNQLILNYCYGHSNSSALFFPYVSLLLLPFTLKPT